MNSTLKKLFKTFLPLLVIVLAVAGAVILVKTRPIPKPREMEEYATLVEIQSLSKTRQAVQLETTGTVIPERQISLQSRVAGEVIWMNPGLLPGGRVPEGEILLKLDPVDYELALDLRKTDLEQARLNLAKEQGMQTVARHEWELIDSREEVPASQKDLILRKPYLKAAKASLAAAEASVKQAELNLERTQIRAPFDAVILSRSVDLGAQVSAQTVLAQLAGTKEFWVETTLPVDQLHWIDVPSGAQKKGSPAEIFVRTDSGEDAVWSGHVIRLKSQLESRGRLAQLLISIPDPLESSTDRLPLLLDSHVRVEITGPDLEQVFILPRRAIRDGNEVWLMNEDSRLEIRPVEILWGNAEQVAISEGLQEGEQLVISDLPAPAPDMLLKNSADSEEVMED